MTTLAKDLLTTATAVLLNGSVADMPLNRLCLANRNKAHCIIITI